MTDFRYKAFISYSWSDAAWGKWVHTALETYRTPKALVGKQTAIGPVPATLHPLFKDREEEAAGASIGAAVEAALGASEFLIVICSPRSAHSQWVNHEVAWFKTHRDPAHILALIVDGEPGSRDAECFPAALTHRVLADLTVTGDAEGAPLAADARDSGDGKRRAKLKLAAAMLGVGLDELVRRDERRRALRTRIVVGASLALAVVMSSMAYLAIQARNEAQHQRSEADGLVEFMLTDLRKKLEPVGRLDALDVVGQRALKYYAGQDASDLDPNALGRRSRALHLVGEVRDLRGDSEAALLAFRSAAATTRELLRRDPKNGQRIFDHAQSVYWVGYIAYQRGETKEAEAAFRDYKKYADQLVALDPKKPEWQMERKYAESNLGTLLFEVGRYAEAEPVFVKAMQLAEVIAAKRPDDAALQMDFANALSWLATTREYLGQQKAALALLAREISIYQRLMQSQASNTVAHSQLVNALASVARNQLASGNLRAAMESYETALAMNRKLLAIEPNNMAWHEVDVSLHNYFAEVLILASLNERARSELKSARTTLDMLFKKDPKNSAWSQGHRGQLELQEATLAKAESRFAAARASLARIASLVQGSNAVSQKHALDTTRRRASLLTGDLLARDRDRVGATSAWNAALTPNPIGEKTLSPLDRTTNYAALVRLGRIAEARVVGSSLDRLDYRHPFYVREKAEFASNSDQ